MRGIGSLLGGLGLVAVAFGLLSALLAIFQPVTDPTWIIGNLAVGVLLLSAALFVSFDSVRQRLRSGEARRVGRYGSSALLQTLLIIALLGMSGFLANRHAVRFDWSEQQVQLAGTSQSLKVLEGLDRDVKCACAPSSSRRRFPRSAPCWIATHTRASTWRSSTRTPTRCRSWSTS